MGLREIREARKAEAQGAYTIDGLAAVLGVTAPTYRRLEEEPGRMTMDQAATLARYYGMRLGEFLVAVEGK